MRPGFCRPARYRGCQRPTEWAAVHPLQPPPRGASGVQPIEHTHELAGVLARVFKLGPMQEGYLCDAINDAYTHNGIAPRGWIAPDAVGWPSFNVVLPRLRDMKGTAALVTNWHRFVN